jgi:chromosome segregation ATPase
MSAERFDRLESQLSEFRELMQQSMVATQQNMTVMQQDIIAMKQNIDAVRDDITALRHRIDSVEGTQNAVIREGFKSLMDYNDDLNYELSDNTRQTRLLKRRIIRLERKNED